MDTLAVTNGHKLAETRLCRKPGCPNEVRAGAPEHGRWGNLCQECYDQERRRASSEQRGSQNSQSVEARSKVPSDFEDRARVLMQAGRRLDRAIASHKITSSELRDAMNAWNAARQGLEKATA